MTEARERYASLEDKTRMEATPVAERWQARSIYEALTDVAGRHPERPALSIQIRSGVKEKAETSRLVRTPPRRRARRQPLRRL
jgi:hypothetical protein